MTHSSERNELRQVFFAAWQKHLKKLPIEPLETQIVEIILQHPEYHEIFSDSENQEKNFGEENPFLHLSLHLALREQITTNRPYGIREIHLNLCKKWNDSLKAEHFMIDCLAEILWEAQTTGKMPDENDYLNKLKNI